MPGRRVAAVRWEGVAEGITFVDQTIQTFKSNLLQPDVSRQFAGSPSTINTKASTSSNTPTTSTSSLAK